MDVQAIIIAVTALTVFQPFIDHLQERLADEVFDMAKGVAAGLRRLLLNDGHSREVLSNCRPIDQMKNLAEVLPRRYEQDTSFAQRFDLVAQEWEYKKFLKRTLVELLRDLDGDDLEAIAGFWVVPAGYPSPLFFPVGFKNRLVHDVVDLDRTGRRLIELIEALHSWRPDFI